MTRGEGTVENNAAPEEGPSSAMEINNRKKETQIKEEPAPEQNQAKRKRKRAQQEAQEEEAREMEDCASKASIKRSNATDWSIEDSEIGDYSEGDKDEEGWGDDHEFYEQWEDAYGVPYPYKSWEAVYAEHDALGEQDEDSSELTGLDFQQDPPCKRRRLRYKQECKEIPAPVTELPEPEMYSQDRQPDPLMSGWLLECTLLG